MSAENPYRASSATALVIEPRPLGQRIAHRCGQTMLALGMALTALVGWMVWRAAGTMTFPLLALFVVVPLPMVLTGAWLAVRYRSHPRPRTAADEPAR